MRLPAISERQKMVEDSREFNEKLYDAHKKRKRLTFRCGPWNCKGERLKYASGVRTFWTSRGFRLRTSVTSDHTQIEVWIEPGQPTRRRREHHGERVESMAADETWSQPRVR